MDNDQLKKFVNKIFQKKGYPPVKNFGKEFADGGKYLFQSMTRFYSAFLIAFQPHVRRKNKLLPDSVGTP